MQENSQGRPKSLAATPKAAEPSATAPRAGTTGVAPSQPIDAAGVGTTEDDLAAQWAAYYSQFDGYAGYYGGQSVSGGGTEGSAPAEASGSHPYAAEWAEYYRQQYAAGLMSDADFSGPYAAQWAEYFRQQAGAAAPATPAAAGTGAAAPGARQLPPAAAADPYGPWVSPDWQQWQRHSSGYAQHAAHSSPAGYSGYSDYDALGSGWWAGAPYGQYFSAYRHYPRHPQQHQRYPPSPPPPLPPPPLPLHAALRHTCRDAVAASPSHPVRRDYGSGACRSCGMQMPAADTAERCHSVAPSPAGSSRQLPRTAPEGVGRERELALFLAGFQAAQQAASSSSGGGTHQAAPLDWSVLRRELESLNVVLFG